MNKSLIEAVKLKVLGFYHLTPKPILIGCGTVLFIIFSFTLMSGCIIYSALRHSEMEEKQRIAAQAEADRIYNLPENVAAREEAKLAEEIAKAEQAEADRIYNLPENVAAREKEQYKAAVEAGTIFDFDLDTSLTKNDKKILKKAAVRALNDDPKCKVVVMGFPSTMEKGKYIIHCVPGDIEEYNITFSPEELVSNAVIKRAEKFPTHLAKQLCEKAIRTTVTNPSTVELSNASDFENPSDNRVIDYNYFDGAAYKARCWVYPNGKGEVIPKNATTGEGRTIKF